jgi:ABC-type multidrug transport system, ATPase component
MDTILEVQGLKKKYEKSDFRLDDISFSLPSGAIMGLVGENGSGKTTTIGCILNTIIKDSGTVRIFEKEMKDESTEIREDIGVVFDANNFSDDLTAAKLSSVMKQVYENWDNDLFNEYLRKFNLSAKQKIKAYSRGMTMKLGIAVALSHHPKFLILDEATSGLDPIARDEILDVFLDFVQDETHSILLSSHITTDLEKIADYITFIHEGRLILTAKKDDLIYNYGVIRCKSSQFEKIDKDDMVAYKRREHQIDVLVSDKRAVEKKYNGFVIDNVSIENIMLLLVKGEK